MEVLFDSAKSSFELMGEVFVVSLWFALIITGFVLILFFVGAICISIYEWVKKRLKK